MKVDNYFSERPIGANPGFTVPRPRCSLSYNAKRQRPDRPSECEVGRSVTRVCSAASRVSSTGLQYRFV